MRQRVVKEEIVPNNRLMHLRKVAEAGKLPSLTDIAFMAADPFLVAKDLWIPYGALDDKLPKLSVCVIDDLLTLEVLCHFLFLITFGLDVISFQPILAELFFQCFIIIGRKFVLRSPNDLFHV